MNRMIQLAVAAALVLVTLPLIFSNTSQKALAKPDSNVLLCPDGGLLEARDANGLTLGPCVLKHTDVKATVQGRFTRVTVTQKYHNSLKEKIEAVYTFPLSNRAAVDRMNMTIGDRVIIGQVREREAAKQMYESAKAQGNVASLLEQERPNIFTQNIANIDPGADIDIEISYVETLESKDGVYSFAFPTVVSPRYIPGQMPQWRNDEQARGDLERGNRPPPPPDGCKPRHGVVLAAPAEVKVVGWKDQATRDQVFDAETFAVALAQADAITPPLPKVDESMARAGAIEPGLQSPSGTAHVLYQFVATYPNGEQERGTVMTDYTGEVDGRWYYLPRHERSWSRVNQAPAAGEPFARPTAQVPDADRITPTPVRPPFRSGQDISVTVDLDTGGAGLTEVIAPLHQVRRQDASRRPDGLASRATIVLAGQNEIPNRDFVLNWKQTSDTINDAVFTSHTKQGDFFAIMLDPPARVEDAQAVPRELIFVLDTSGSMNGPPIEKAKELATKMVQTMRPQDTFNFITFAGATSVLWEKPRPNTDANRQEALAFFSRKGGSGGTEMMTAINAALEQRAGGAPVPLTLEDLANLPADGRNVSVGCLVSAISQCTGDGEQANQMSLRVRSGLSLKAQNLNWSGGNPNSQVTLAGQWTTVAGERVLNVQSVTMSTTPVVNPLRIVVFLTDGEVGNDMAIIDAVKRNRGTTRVFSYGIGNSVNRYLLSEVAKQGGGEAEFILIPHDAGAEQIAQADAAARRLHEKTRTPVLANISLEFSPNLSVADLEPGPGQIPDMYDIKPLVLLGRFTQPPTADGFVTIRGITGSGLWEKTLKLSPQAQVDTTDRRLSSVGGDGVVATLWARARVDSLMNGHLAEIQRNTTPAAIKQRIIQLGENFGIMSQFTSFVAVDYQRITIEGRPRLVRVPVELPDQTMWENYFCSDVLVQPVEKLSELLDRSEEYKASRDSSRFELQYRMTKLLPEEKLKQSEMRTTATDRTRALQDDAAADRKAPGKASSRGGLSAKPSAPPPPAPAPAATPTGSPAPTPPGAPASVTSPAPSKSLPSVRNKVSPVSGQPPDADAAPKPTAFKKDESAARGESKQLGASAADPAPSRPAGTGGAPANGPGDAMSRERFTVREQSPREGVQLELRLRSDKENQQFGAMTVDHLTPVPPAPPPPADFNRDGQATMQDLFDFVDAWFGEGGQPAIAGGGGRGGGAPPPPAPASSIRKVEDVSSATTVSALPLPQESTPRRMAPLVAARLMAASIKSGQMERAAALRDRFLPQFPDSKALKDAAALLPVAKSDTEKGLAGDDSAKNGSPAPAGLPAPDAAAIEALVKQIDESAAAEMKLARRLDRELYMKLPGNVTVTEDKAETVLVTVLLDNLTPDRLDALKKAGLDVRSSVERDKIVVGFIKLTKLEGLALLDGVKKIEPVEDAAG